MFASYWAVCDGRSPIFSGPPFAYICKKKFGPPFAYGEKFWSPPLWPHVKILPPVSKVKEHPPPSHKQWRGSD